MIHIFQKMTFGSIFPPIPAAFNGKGDCKGGKPYMPKNINTPQHYDFDKSSTRPKGGKTRRKCNRKNRKNLLVNFKGVTQNCFVLTGHQNITHHFGPPLCLSHFSKILNTRGCICFSW
ncbi:hypothetical protein KKH23_04505 [Patescibacteria group bacterium]|nr:hypothetical protein [Patescibacteria group bacterium]